MKRFSIWGREYGADHDVELAQVDSNPEQTRKALAAKTLIINHSALPGGKKSKTSKFTWLRIVDNENGETA